MRQVSENWWAPYFYYIVFCVVKQRILCRLRPTKLIHSQAAQFGRPDSGHLYTGRSRTSLLSAVFCCGGRLSHYPGRTIFSGRTSRSNSAAVTWPLATASSRNVVPFACAALAILAAWS